MTGESVDETGVPIRTVKTPAGLITLLAQTAIAANGTINGAAVTGLEKYTLATIILTLSAKSMDAGTTLDVYVQYSPDGGTTWDDLAHFAQITSGAMGNGSYLATLNGAMTPPQSDRAATDGTLAANAVRDASWCDRLRVKTVAANFGGADTITVKLEAYLQ